MICEMCGGAHERACVDEETGERRPWPLDNDPFDPVCSFCRAAAAIEAERGRQPRLWGDPWDFAETHPAIKLAILTEEVGEVAKAILDAPKGSELETPELRRELVRVAAVAVSWVESFPVGADSGQPS